MREAIQLAIGYILLDTPWYLMACAPFMGSLRIRKATLLSWVVGIALLRGASVFLLALFLPDQQDYETLLYIVYYAVLITMFFLAFRISPVRLFYVFLLVYTISTCINQISAGVLRFLFPNERINMSDFPLLTAMDFAVTLLLLPFLYRFFKGRLRQAIENLDTKSIMLLCVTPMVFAVVALIFVVYTAGRLHRVQQSILSFLFSAAGLLSYFVNLWMLMNSAAQLRKEGELQTQLALQAQGYENLTRSIEAARTARHDLRHHLNVIRDCAQRGDNEALLAYLAEYTAALPSDSGPDYCGNPAVNVLLRHYLARAERAGAALDIRVDLRAGTGIPDADLCTVFGNLFENAAKSVEAQRSGAKFIRARCASRGSDILLTLENSVGEASPGERLGLKSAAMVAEKYKGEARSEQRGGQWHSAVLLRIPESPAEK